MYAKCIHTGRDGTECMALVPRRIYWYCLPSSGTSACGSCRQRLFVRSRFLSCSIKRQRAAEKVCWLRVWLRSGTPTCWKKLGVQQLKNFLKTYNGCPRDQKIVVGEIPWHTRPSYHRPSRTHPTLHNKVRSCRHFCARQGS